MAVYVSNLTVNTGTTFSQIFTLESADTNGYTQYKKMKSAKKSQREELDRIKEDIEEIKLLLKQIASK